MLQREREEFLQPEEDHEKVMKMLATAYVQYLGMLRNLEAAHAHLIHQQKRAAVRQVLDGVIGRLLEIKREMVALEKCECHHMDGILMDLKRVPEPVTAMTLEEGIKVIQVAERARQGRARAAFMKGIYLEEKRQSRKEDQETGKNPDDAATCIQKVWRGYSQRKRTEKLREEEMIFLGMSLPPDLEAMSCLQKANVLEGEVQKREDISFRQELRTTEGPHIKETLQDQITQCFLECRHVTGRFPDYPPEKTGGSKAIFIEKHPEQVVDLGWKMGPSNFLSILEEGSAQYQVFWEKRDNRADFLQDHDPELIKGGEREEVEEEIRVQVDEVMQEKLLNIKKALDGEIGPQGKAKKGEKGSKSPGKKKISELERDLTPDRTIDSLYQELAEEGLLIKVKHVHLSDYIGYYDCLRSTLRETGAQPVPSIPEVRQLVALYGILPLGSQTVHENAPLVKSLLLAGPAGVGKKMLVHAICTETGANLFNLTPSNLAGKYPGREGLMMMLHMILKMNFKRLAKLLPQFLKALKPKDRVLLVGTTSRPFDANMGPFCKAYQKIILIPKPDYLTRFALWKHYILQGGGALTKLVNLNCLAQVSDGFTQAHVVDVVHTVLTELRLLQMDRKPLRTAEFVTSLARHNPVYKEEEEMFQQNPPLNARFDSPA
ncbi:dynein regulatory complex protein 11 [Sylvia borin]